MCCRLFGYIKPFKPDLKIKEYEVYKSVYCSLCKHIGKNYGIISRLTLSYDCTFLILMYIAISNQAVSFNKKKCVVNPIKSCSFCNGYDSEFKFVSAVSVIMTYYKIKDDINDSSSFKKFYSSIILKLLSGGYQKAKYDYPDVESLINRYSNDQEFIEKDNSCDIDISSSPTATMMSGVMAMLSSNIKTKRVLSEFGYYLGRWIYLIDACDDIKKDIENNNFNPLRDTFISFNDIDKFNAYCNQVLNLTLSRALSAYNLLHIEYFKPILDNIMKLGLPYIQKKTIFNSKEV